MSGANNMYVGGLIGDFYQAHSDNNDERRRNVLDNLNRMVEGETVDNQPFIFYFNEVFSGRSGFNTLLTVSDYPKESILRELLQNAIGCKYESDDIKIVINLQGDGVIGISYNEAGFTLEDVLYYLSFGRNGGDSTREGRFGVGAKSVFFNSDWLSLKSNRFSFKIERIENRLSITELDMFGEKFNGTTVTFKVSDEEYDKISENLMTLAEKRGAYLNFVELCFAFNRKKPYDEENDHRTINLAVAQENAPCCVYRVSLHRSEQVNTPVIRLFCNGKSVVDFLFYENEGFVYLIPYAVANARREKVIGILLEKYNYFSTYELTGLLREDSERILEDKLSAFFVSVPNSFISNTRTGIKAECEGAIQEAIQRDLAAMLKLYRDCFVLMLRPIEEGGNECVFAPKSYAFSFFYRYLQSCNYAKKIMSVFIDSISLLFPGEDSPVAYDQIRDASLKSDYATVRGQYAQDGTADRIYIEDAITQLENRLPDVSDKVLYAAYTREDEDSERRERVYAYKITRGDAVYTVRSRAGANTPDYGLGENFPSIAGHFLPEIIDGDSVENEEVLERALALFDESYGENYTLIMKYYRLHVSCGTDNFSFEVSKINVENLKNAMNSVENRRARFLTTQNYTEVVSMLVNSFTQGKDTMDFMRIIKSQGGTIGLALDFNNKYRFSVYGKQLMIPSTITNADFLELFDDPVMLLDSGVLIGRKFDFPIVTSKYSVISDETTKILSNYVNTETIELLQSRIFISNMKYSGVFLCDADEKIIALKSFGDAISDDERAAAARYVIMRDELSKLEYADFVEYILCGACHSILSGYFSRTKAPIHIIPDQISLEMRCLPHLTCAEQKVALEIYDEISKKAYGESLVPYFAKDINGRIYGYGGLCGACGTDRGILNSMTLKDFSIDIMSDDCERKFSFTLYLCKNHAAESDGWLLSDLSIGGMSPFNWLEEISRAESIPYEFFYVTLRYSPQIAYSATDGTEIATASESMLNFKLTPLMAAKWIRDNR